jgi:hypothetical protein
MNYYLDQTRMVEAILTEAGMKGVYSRGDITYYSPNKINCKIQ